MRFSDVKNFFLTLGEGVRKDWKASSIIVLSNLLSAFAISNFVLPYRFPDLGVTGLAFLSHYLFHISPSWVIFIGNALLLAWGWKNLSPRFVGLTIWSITSFSLALPIFILFPLPLPEDKFMAIVISGVLKGIAGGMTFNTGGSGGGTDIIAAVMRRRYGVEVGQLSIILNLFVLGLSLGVVGLGSVVYGVVGLYITGITLDNAMRSFDRRKQAFVITNIPDDVGHFIMSMGRGVTRLEGRGAYTGQERPVLLSLLEPRQVVQLKNFLQEKDSTAFVSICDASEVLGNGFKNWKAL